MKKLYVSDVDGTLYRGKSEGLSETGRELFIRLMQEGVGVTVASGRNLYGVYDLAASCGITLPVIAYNGAVIYDFGKGKAERTFPIQPADAQGLFERFDRQKIPYKTCVFRPQEERCVTYLQNRYRSPNWSERKKRIEQGCEDAVHPQNGLVYDEPFVDVPLSQLLEGECLYIGSSGEQQAITAIYEQAKQMPGVSTVLHCSPYDSRRWFVDIGSDQAGKGKAAVALKQMLGAQQLVTFGDNHNDIPMLLAADRSYVVPQAPQEARQAATAVLEEDVDCVLQFIWKEYRADKTK